jgi:hypothetical protein
METFVASSSQSFRPRSPRGSLRGSRPVIGPLKALGYTVGESGLTVAERRDILQFALDGDLPRSITADIREEWGRPNTSRRRFKIINSLKGFIFLRSRRKDGSGDCALHDWAGDLEWFVTILAPGPLRGQD